MEPGETSTWVARSVNWSWVTFPAKLWSSSGECLWPWCHPVAAVWALLQFWDRMMLPGQFRPCSALTRAFLQILWAGRTFLNLTGNVLGYSLELVILWTLKSDRNVATWKFFVICSSCVYALCACYSFSRRDPQDHTWSLWLEGNWRSLGVFHLNVPICGICGSGFLITSLRSALDYKPLL